MARRVLCVLPPVARITDLIHMATRTKGFGGARTYVIASDGESILCVRCGLRSHNENDVKHRYCGKCGWHDLVVDDAPALDTVKGMIARALDHAAMSGSGVPVEVIKHLKKAYEHAEAEQVVRGLADRGS
jgi:ribosomal protein L37E